MASTNDCDFVCGAVGTLIDELPLITHAHVKPYIVAILLHRGAVRFNEIISSISPHCAVVDLRVGAWDEIENCEIEDKTRLELIVEEVLGEMVSSGMLRYNETHDLWVLSVGSNQCNLPKIMNWVSATDGQLPHHILLDLSKQQRFSYSVNQV